MSRKIEISGKDSEQSSLDQSGSRLKKEEDEFEVVNKYLQSAFIAKEVKNISNTNCVLYVKMPSISTS